MSKSQLIEHLAQATGIDAGEVEKVLGALAETACSQISEGFALPGLGMFRLVQGPERKIPNPFRPGEFLTTRLPPQGEFEANTELKEHFYAGIKPTLSSSLESRPNRSLPTVRLLPHEEDARFIKGISSESRCKLGGNPDWIQGPETPVCCGYDMQFYGQLDSIGGEFIIGDVGMIYVFYCENCCSTRSIMQCY